MKSAEVYSKEYEGRTVEGHHGAEEFVRPDEDKIASDLYAACLPLGHGTFPSAGTFLWVGEGGVVSKIGVSEERHQGNKYTRRLDIETMPAGEFPADLASFLRERGFAASSK